MFKKGLKLDRVHTYVDLCLSQLEEKITWVIEMTTGSPLSSVQLQEKLALVVIVNISAGILLESEKSHKEHYDLVNTHLKCKVQNFSAAKDLTNPFKNFMQVRKNRQLDKYLGMGGYDYSNK